MKLILLLLFITGGIGVCLFPKKQAYITKNPPPADTINFITQVQPILQKNCSPCHFPGGKMYIKMPFDSGHTILSHEAGIIRRIKNEKEKEVIVQYIRENKIAP